MLANCSLGVGSNPRIFEIFRDLNRRQAKAERRHTGNLTWINTFWRLTGSLFGPTHLRGEQGHSSGPAHLPDQSGRFESGVRLATTRKDLDEAEARLEGLKCALAEVKKAVRDAAQLLHSAKGKRR